MPDSALTDRWLATFPRLRAMREDHLTLALRDVQFPQLREGDVAYRQGWDCPNYVMCISGRTRVFKTSESGREILIYRVASGGTCVLTTQCLMAGGTFPAESVAETDATLAALPAATFHKMMSESSAFRSLVLDDYVALLSSMIVLLDEVAFASLEQRLARRLLAEADSEGFISKTHQQLAFDLGTVREVISRYLSVWERAGWIKTSRGRIEISDRRALAGHHGASSNA